MARLWGQSERISCRKFKAVTDMSPLQFQEHIRLQGARRLMIGEDVGAAGAGHRVGYEDASHFRVPGLPT